ncbi:MAG: TonB-dependent receptor [gamma proteobacterium symbiont of Bathyaustriella thionipta]|nr:TonB-dependent receptor [gamma proteobacterium symbiont of Bathyaustriella thionipta]
MKKPVFLLSVLTGLLLTSGWTLADTELPTMQVESQFPDGFKEQIIIPEEQKYISPDSADLLRNVPGANVNKNGPLTGISQYRGMYGSRVNVLVDGLNVAPAGPNWMDPPLSMIPSSQLQDIRVIRGVSPVSAGSETVGGTIMANSRRGDFSAGEQFDVHGRVGLGGQTVNDGYSGNTRLWLSNNRHLFEFNGLYLKGDDMDAGNSDSVIPSGYERKGGGLGYAFQQGETGLGFNYQYDKTEDSGTPALPMDIIFVKTNNYRGHYNDRFGRVNTNFKFHYIDTDHLMDNFSQRQPPVAAMSGLPVRRFAETDSSDWGWDLRGDMAAADGELRFGTDGWMPTYNADIFNPSNTGFKVNNYNHVKRNRFGLFSEWQGVVGNEWGVLVGGRFTRVAMDADEVASRGIGGMGQQARADELAGKFNNSHRSQDENLYDLALIFDRAVSEHTTLQIGLEHKQRAPSYQERFLWLPLESTAGLADNRVYVGDIGLDKETSYNLDVGLNWQTGDSYFTPHTFYKRVDNYIQGTPLTSGTAYEFRRNQANMLLGAGTCPPGSQDPVCVPLQFSNVDAEFYGFDAAAGTRLSRHWKLDATLSYVRGKRRDINDDLYRIAPLNGLLGLSYETDDWSLTAEGAFYAKQDKVSETNNEQETSSYGLLNLYGHYEFQRHLRLRAGVRNVFDRYYENHLSGYNRVSADSSGNSSDIAVGERLPGAGRNFFLQAEANF